MNGFTIQYDIAPASPPIITCISGQKEVVRINQDGRIFWNGREVETDDDFRHAIMDLTKIFIKQRN